MEFGYSNTYFRRKKKFQSTTKVVFTLPGPEQPPKFGKYNHLPT